MSQDSSEIRIPLPRGRVWRALAIYTVIALLILPALSALVDFSFFPKWIAQWFVLALFVGIGVTAVTAWLRGRRT